MIVFGISLFLLAVANTQQQNITYNVIAAPESLDMSVAVVVDSTIYPLSMSYSSSILYQGSAPVAKEGYHYTILDANEQLHATEPFTRSPIKEASTANEFFNRSVNFHEILSLPQILPPLSSIERIESKLHVPGMIPTLHFWGNEAGIKDLIENQTEDVQIKLNVTYISAYDIQNFQNVKISLAGRSSRYRPKPSYTIKLGKKKDDSLYGYKDIKLRALTSDPSYVRENIIYGAVKSIGLAASEFSYARLFINNKPIGLYGLIEIFQSSWLANEFAGGDKNYKPGHLYQGLIANLTAKPTDDPQVSDLSYHGDLSVYNSGQYKVKAGSSKKKIKSYADLQEFTKFVSEANVKTTVDEWEEHLDTQSFIRAMAIEDLFGFSDGYMTCDDNFYLYSDPEHLGRMTYLPTDFDTTLGHTLFKIDLMISGNYSQHPGFSSKVLTEKLFVQETFLSAYKSLLYKLSQTLVNPTVLNPYIDSIATMIRNDVAWDKTLPRQGQSYPGAFKTEYAAVYFNKANAPGRNSGKSGSFKSDANMTFEEALSSSSSGSVRGFIALKSANTILFYSKSKPQ